MAEFDLAAVLGDVSMVDTAQEQLRYLPYAALVLDQANGYSMDGLEELARSIEIVGLLQPLRVRSIPDAADAWRIIAGHRRHAAIGLLIERGSRRFEQGVPCVIDRAAASEALQELKLLMANAENRKLTPADEMQQKDRISDCLRRLEAEGYRFNGRHRDWVSKLSGLSKTKLARLDAIQHNLITALIGPFNEGLLPETTAYELQKLPAEYQLEAFGRMNKKKGFVAVPANLVSHCVEHIADFEAAHNCPAGPSCTQHARRLSATFAAGDYAWLRCDGQCCMTCSVRERCHFPCESAAKKMREEEKAEKAKEARREAERAEESKKQQAELRKKLQASARRLTPLLDAAGVPDDERLPLKSWGSVAAGTVRACASGEFGEERQYDSNFMPRNVVDLKAVCKRLRCSADYLLGLSNRTLGQFNGTEPDADAVSETDTAPEWKGGDPQKAGRYWCKFLVKGQTISRAAVWDGESWRFNNIEADIRALCVGWWPLPED